MRILFLDDNENRHRSFLAQNIGHVVVPVYKARHAINALEMYEPFDVASLDHDLDWQATAGLEPLEETGLTVARHIASMPPERRPKMVIVHSFNPVGAQAMYDVLAEAGVNVARGPYAGKRY